MYISIPQLSVNNYFRLCVSLCQGCWWGWGTNPVFGVGMVEEHMKKLILHTHCDMKLLISSENQWKLNMYKNRFNQFEIIKMYQTGLTI